jgi:tRNA-splicing ligase RtcB
MYESAIRTVSAFFREMRTGKMKVPVVFHVQEELMPNDDTLAQLESVAANDGVFQHIAAMADVHSKPGRKNATGTTIATTGQILPQLNDSDPACGMRLVRTNLTDENTSPEEIDRLFQALVPRVPTKAYLGTYLPFRIIVDIARKGTRPLIEHLGIKTKYEAENSLDRGNFFTYSRSRDSSATLGMTSDIPSRRDILNILPSLFLFFAQFRSGILGAAGNHFLDLMKVSDTVDPALAEKLGVKKGQYLFMVHCGSGILGQYTMYMYTAKKREHKSTAVLMNLGRFFWRTPYRNTVNVIARKIRESDFGEKEPLIAFSGAEADLYMAARNACSNFAHANRAVITHNVSETIKRVLGRDPEMELLYDMPHILVSRERHFGEDVWVHRNGTSRAYGPARMADHPVFKETGEPAFIPTSMSTEAYLCVGTDANDSSFFSCNHGAGKSKTKTDTVVPDDKAALDRKLASKGVRLYNGRSSKVIEQDSAHYKRAEDVITSVKENGIVKPVARMQPVAVIMY